MSEIRTRGSGAIVRSFLTMSLSLTISKAITLPIIAVYLSDTLALGTTVVGYILSASLAIGTLSSLYGGHIVDHADRRILLFGGIAVYGATYFAFPHIRNGWTVFALLALSYSAASLLDIAIKVYLAQLVEPADRVKVFSLRYTLNNVGFAVGPMVGAYLAMHSEAALFRLSGVAAFICMVPAGLVWGRLKGREPCDAPSQSRSFYATLGALKGDACLLTFTLAGTFAAVIYARFSAYLSQYLAVATDTHTAYQTVAYAITANALIVVLFQYLIGARITVSRLRPCITIGMLLFGAGLFGFSRSTGMTAWMIAMVIFSLGEVIVIPASYLFVDSIAPEDMKGSYYGMQSLTNLGGAASPALCGLLISSAQPKLMFWVLIAVCGVAWWLFLVGDRLKTARSSISMVTRNR
ncbi:MFS transporter [Burkholderia ubonensis]|nr:MFS transporter [Burkholderia ubonensis]